MKILKNYLYNSIYQIIAIIIPIITVPYISRVFSPEQIGVNSYTLSIAQYFILLAGLGVSIYGNRTIAYIKDDETKRVQYFWSIFFVILFSTIISLVAYLILIFFFIKDNIYIYLIQSLYIISVACDVSWLFMGMEDFKKIVIRNISIKIIGLICIFIFVKEPNDLYKYMLILSLTNLIGIISMWIYIPQYIKGFYFDISSILIHIKPLIVIYIPQVAIQVYAIMDKTMLGNISDSTQVGYYDMSQRIVRIVLALVTSLGVVMIPHISSLLGKNKFDEVEKEIGNTFRYMSYLAFPMSFGLSLISLGFSEWFFGTDFVYTGNLMALNSFVIISITWSNIIGMQLLMPMMKEKEFTFSVVCGAVVNVILNLILIPKYGGLGAVIATIIAEFTVTITQILIIKKYFSVYLHIISTWKSALASIIMYIFVKNITYNMSYTLYTTSIQVLLSILIYLIVMKLLKSEVQNELINKVKSFRR